MKPEIYRYTDGQGRIVIVDSWSEVPISARPRAELVQLAEPPSAAPSWLPSAPAGLDLPSFAAGFGSALVLGLGLLAVRRLNGPFGRIAVFLFAAAALGALYLGLLRRSTGQSDTLLTSPSAVIQDARDAVERLNERNQKQEQEIQKILRDTR